MWAVWLILAGLVLAAAMFAAVMYPAASFVLSEDPELVLPVYAPPELDEPSERPPATDTATGVRARSVNYGTYDHRPQSQMLGYL